MPSPPNALLTLAVVLVCGVAGGALARRVRLPSVVGQIVVGVLLGPWGFRVFAVETVHDLEPVTHFALGLIAVAVGGYLNIQRLRNAVRRLTLLLALETTLTPAIVFVCVYFVAEVEWPFALLLAALAVSTAPATIIAIVKETRSKGVFVKTLVSAVALNNVACILLFEVSHVAARVALAPGGDHSAADAVVAPLRQLLASFFLGGGVGVGLVAATRHTVRPERLATASMIAILLTAGLAEYMGISALLACLFLGLALANLTPEKEELGHPAFANFEGAIFAVFFTLAGLELDFSYVLPAGVVALVAVTARLVGKLSAARLAMRLAGATDRVRRYLGMALVPQAGIAIGLILLVQEDPDLAPIAHLLLAVGLTTVAFNELVGSILTRIALTRSGDFQQDRARLIDFLHEENIVTDLEARTKEEAIEQLVDVLIRTNHLAADREQLLASVLEREADFSTCLGNGLAIPHGVLDDGAGIVGAMGISRRGLWFDTPDNRPVHCMVVLATPPDQRDRHLEVIAALAHAIGHDRNIQLQVYTAKSAAHAYEVLHAEGAADFNYYLEDIQPG